MLRSDFRSALMSAAQKSGALELVEIKASSILPKNERKALRILS